MNPADALDIGQAAIWTVIIASAPAVAGAMLIVAGCILAARRPEEASPSLEAAT
jgi:flagellar biosynthetic protein FliQ